MKIGNVGQLDFFRHDIASFGGDFVFKGYPAENRDGNVFLTMQNLAISETCTDKDAAWEFLRIFLTEEYQRDNTIYSIPANKVVFEEQLKEFMKPTGSWIPLADGTEFEIKGLSQKQADMIRDIVNNITRVRSSDDTIWTLVSESASDFFNGLITARDAARIIQSRVSIYLAEQG